MNMARTKGRMALRLSPLMQQSWIASGIFSALITWANLSSISCFKGGVLLTNRGIPMATASMAFAGSWYFDMTLPSSWGRQTTSAMARISGIASKGWFGRKKILLGAILFKWFVTLRSGAVPTISSLYCGLEIWLTARARVSTPLWVRGVPKKSTILKSSGMP